MRFDTRWQLNSDDSAAPVPLTRTTRLYFSWGRVEDTPVQSPKVAHESKNTGASVCELPLTHTSELPHSDGRANASSDPEDPEFTRPRESGSTKKPSSTADLVTSQGCLADSQLHKADCQVGYQLLELP